MQHAHDYIKEKLGLLDPVDIGSFQDQYSALIRRVIPQYQYLAGKHIETNKKVFRVLDIPQQLFKSLENDCRIQQLECEVCEDIETIFINDTYTFTIPDGVELATLQLQKADIEKRKKDPYYRRLCRRNYFSGVSKVVLDDNKAKKECDQQMVNIYSDCRLTVQFYRPPKINKPSRYFPEIDQEFIVLGLQSLTDLRDAITCTADFVVTGEFSNNPDVSRETRAIDIFPSGFFLINNTFYNDMRESDSQDYSEVIMNWASEKDRGVGPFSTQLMESVRICDLTIELGYPYVYVHQGSCEHILVFHDLRLIGHYDNCFVDDYPKIEQIFPKKRRPCSVCRIFTSKWITFNNKHTNDDPYFFCDACFRSFNYTEDGQKIGEFKAYPYIDPTATN